MARSVGGVMEVVTANLTIDADIEKVVAVASGAGTILTNRCTI